MGSELVPILLLPDSAVTLPISTCQSLSPQSYFNLYGGDAKITAHKVVMCLSDGHVRDILINTALNLLVISSPQPMLKEQDKYGPHLLSLFVLNILDLPGLAQPIYCKIISDVMNHNLSGPQRELLRWHSKLCIYMHHVQELMRDHHYKIPNSDNLVLPPILFTKNAMTRSCLVPRCLACRLSTQKLCSTHVKTS